MHFQATFRQIALRGKTFSRVGHILAPEKGAVHVLDRNSLICDNTFLVGKAFARTFFFARELFAIDIFCLTPGRRPVARVGPLSAGNSGPEALVRGLCVMSMLGWRVLSAALWMISGTSKLW